MRPAVVLIHGLARTPRSFGRVDAVYEAAGFTVHRFGYPSRRAPLAESVTAAAAFLAALPGACVVGHSLGGLVAVEAMTRLHAQGWPVGGLVTLGTPWQGAAAARLCRRLPPVRWVLGPVLEDLATYGTPRPPPFYNKTMSIAGGTGSPRGWNPLFGEDNDGLVTVRETAAPGCAHVTLRALHATFPANREAARVAVMFLRRGLPDGLPLPI